MSLERIPIQSPDGLCRGVLLQQSRPKDAPLLACIPGGGCTGRYFDTYSPSTAMLAHARGFSVLLVDRPGYGASAPIEGSAPILTSLPRIRSLLHAALKDVGLARDIVLIGHSIGGAIALMMAAAPDGLPLRAVAVSGIGDEPPRPTAAWIASLDTMPATPDFSADLFFGEPGTYSWKGPAALRRATQSWWMPEVVEIVDRWPGRWPRVAAEITIPVHLRLSDRDGIWESGERVVRRMANAMQHAPEVDAELLIGGGHAYEFHLRGAELMTAQLDFLERAAS